MKTSPRGILQIISHEAIVVNRYRDIKGIWTIGVGVTARAKAAINPKEFTGTLSVEQCLDLFMEILPQYEAGVRRALDGRKCSQHEFDALVSLAYNAGAGLGPTTHKYIRRGDIAPAIDLWRADPQLKERRDCEVELALTGHYHEKPTAWLLRADRHGKLLWSSSAVKINLNQYLPYLGYNVPQDGSPAVV